jgi:uncharacterized membrane protein
MLGGAAVALLFWWWSLDPSMLPRSPSAQGAVSGLSVAIGYLLGTLAGYGAGRGRRRGGRRRARAPRPPALGRAPARGPPQAGHLRREPRLLRRRGRVPGSDGTASLANLVAGSNGALFTGPTASNHIWDQFTDGREPGTPVWRPVYGGGTKVQFANRPADLERPDEAWRHPRVRYVHHPSDPVGNATVEAFWRRPEWTDRPQGYDVPARAGRYPIVTGLQEVADLIAGFGATSGYGHNYGIDFVTGWAASGSSSTSRPSEAPSPFRACGSGRRSRGRARACGPGDQPPPGDVRPR